MTLNAKINTEVDKTLTEVLVNQGVKNVVLCPGTRNSTLLTAFNSQKDLKVTTIVDERSAGFVALGISSMTSSPVAIVCTSGTAVLNFAPAVAEAYYRKLPLIVISADRPMEWIDQDDSQTLRQRGALDNFVKRSYDVPVIETPDHRWFANRTFNDAMITAMIAPMGPVHINIQIGERDLTSHLFPSESVYRTNERIVEMTPASCQLSKNDALALAEKTVSKSKVMVVAGFMSPDSKLNKALNKLAAHPNIIILTETIANLHGDDFVSEIDATLSAMPREVRDEMAPDIVMTLGGALVSRRIKQYLRETTGLEHWQVGQSLTTVDCFKSLTRRIELEPSAFFKQLEWAMHNIKTKKIGNNPWPESEYRRQWITVRDAARSLHQSFVAKAPWSDLKAFSIITPTIPRRFNVQLSNGTTVRYAQLFADRTFHRCDCNRGVSGIDGSTSTAIGASLAYNSAPTLLITGDMSAQYDLGALANRCMTPRFKMIVMCNGGGGIFHFIKSTRGLKIVNDCFDEPCNFPAQGLAQAFSMDYFEAKDEPALRLALPQFLAESKRPAMLAIFTDADVSANVLLEYFRQKLR